MDWLAALWGDIVASVGNFDLSPPRTVDALAGWLEFLIWGIFAACAFVRITRRYLAGLIPALFFYSTCETIDKLRRELRQWEFLAYYDRRMRIPVIVQRSVELKVHIGLWGITIAMLVSLSGILLIFPWALAAVLLSRTFTHYSAHSAAVDTILQRSTAIEWLDRARDYASGRVAPPRAETAKTKSRLEKLRADLEVVQARLAEMKLPPLRADREIVEQSISEKRVDQVTKALPHDNAPAGPSH